MTDAELLASENENPESLVRYLFATAKVQKHYPVITDRKLRLLIAALGRRLTAPWGGTAEEEGLIGKAERNADGVEGAEKLPALSGYDTVPSLACHPRPAWAVLQVFPHMPDSSDEPLKQARIVLDILGNPFRSTFVDPSWLRWNCGTVVFAAHLAYDERIMSSGELDKGKLAILADVLEDAGCHNADILEHLRGPRPHVRGCWVVDLLLGKK